MTNPNQKKPEEYKDHVIDLTGDINSLPHKEELRDTLAVGNSWTDVEGKLNVPIGLHTQEGGRVAVLAARSPQKGGEAELIYISAQDARPA